MVPSGFRFDRFVEESAVAGRISVGCQAHDFVFVGVEIEPQVQGDDRVENADGVVRRDLSQLFDLIVMRPVSRRTLRFTHAVNDDNQSIHPSQR